MLFYKIKRQISLISVIIFACFTSFVVSAEQKQTLGKWDVHYIAFETAFLTPEIAKQYDIVRSKNIALLNISVLDKRSQAAQIVNMTGTVKNLLGRKVELEFKEVTEGDAVYYLATLDIDHKDVYRFTIEISQGNQRQPLKFQQQFIVD